MDPNSASTMVAGLFGTTGARRDSPDGNSTVWHSRALGHDADGRRYPPPFRVRRRRSVATGI